MYWRFSKMEDSCMDMYIHLLSNPVKLSCENLIVNIDSDTCVYCGRKLK